MMESTVESEDENTTFQYSGCSTESLEELDWDGLLEVCKEKDEKLNLAGTYGLKLHEQLLETQAHIDDMRVQHEAEVEKYIQETFELKSRLELKEKSLVSLQQEFDSQQKIAMENSEANIEEIRNQYKKEASSIKKEKDILSSEVEQIQLRERQANEKIVRLEEKLKEKQVEKKRNVEQKVDQTEVSELLEKINILQEEIEARDVRVLELQNENQSLGLELRSKISESDNNSKDLEEAERRSTSYFNYLQQAREEANEIKMELDVLKAEMRSSGHLQKGNSLFGEVEDKRVEMEKKLLSMQVKHESLQKAYTFVKSQLHNMKTQVVALLQMNSGRADGERISHLERALSQAKAEVLTLSKKIKEAESNQTLSTEGIQACAKSLPEFESNKDMVHFLSLQLDDYKRKMEKLREELDQTHMVKLAESDKLQTVETKLHETGILAEKSKNENMQLRLRLEETKSKLQAETQKRILVEKKFNYDSTGDVVPIGVVTHSSKEKKSIPYTLAKSKEKEKHALKRMPVDHRLKPERIFSSPMDWNLLPKEILKELDVKHKAQNSMNSTDTTTLDILKSEIVVHDKTAEFSSNPLLRPNVKRCCQGSDDRPRKVSFKDEPETIIVASPDQSTILEDTENIPPTTENEIDDQVYSEKFSGSSPVKNKASSPLKMKSTCEMDTKSLTETSSACFDKDNNQDCKVQ